MKHYFCGFLAAAGLLFVTADTLASVTQCDVQPTLISDIQGKGSASLLQGKSVSVKAVVSAVMPGLDGYFLLEEASDWDGSDRTSEGVFVFDKHNKPQVGDLVSLTAQVNEFKGLTQLHKVSAFAQCDSGQDIKTVKLSLPLKHHLMLENYEGMVVEFDQPLTISENYNLARYGQLLLSNGRLFQPSNVVNPGEAAQKLAKSNQLNQLVLDDGSNQKNPPLELDADHLYRVGNQVKGIKGVVHFSYGNYMLEPTAQLQYLPSNPRLDKPQVNKHGTLRVASFNVLNYFNGNGEQKTFPTQRGASSLAEFKRQNAKTIAAMKAIKADVFGLMEVENDGFDEHSAIYELTHNLAAASGVSYRFIKPDSARFGDDAITVGMIYNADKVTPLGKTVTLTQLPFGTKSRLPMAQSFQQKDNGEVFTLVVNHFKSKGRCPKDKTDPNNDKGDGQGCWNHARVESATLLTDWLMGHPTGIKDDDILIIGDLNAYAKEQPVTTIEQAGYINLLEKFQGAQAYSYVYKGLSGYLDHALGSKTLSKQVVDAADWHINADEMPLTDYNMEFKTPKQQQLLYKPNAFRSSDHDPVIIELKLTR